MSLPLAIWTTGSPVPAAEKRRGSFFEMIRTGVGGSFSGEVLDLDSVQLLKYPDPQEMAGIIVTGSPARLATRDEWMKKTEQALRDAHAVGTPILGICFGHQLLGSALGGQVRDNPRGREIGTVHLERIGTDPLFDRVTAEPVVVMSHLDSVIHPPDEAEVLGRTELDPHAILRFSRTTWGVQFHPEMDAEVVGDYLEERRGDIESEGLDVDKILSERRDSSFGKELLQAFGDFCTTRLR